MSRTDQQSRVIDFDKPEQRALVLDRFRSLRGRHRVIVCKYRPRRSDRQNRFYHPAFCEPFADWLCREWGADADQEDAHEILRDKFSKKRIVNEDTGEFIEYACSTTKLDTAEFNEFLDRCAKFLDDYCGIKVGDPSEYHERMEQEAA